MAQIYIVSDELADTKYLYGSKATIGSKKSVDTKPNPNMTDIVEAHTQSIENPKIIINNINIMDSADNSLTMTDIYKLVKHKYDGTNPIMVFIEYGDSSVVPSFDESTTGIPCVLEQYSIVLDTSSSYNASIPSASLTFFETK